MRVGSFWNRFGCWATIYLSVALFIGLMFASAGVAVHPPLGNPAAAILCDGRYEVESRSYSYRPGQSGVSRTFYCERDGRREDISMAVIGTSFVLFSLGAALLLLPLMLPLRRRLADALDRRAQWLRGIYEATDAEGPGGLVARIVAAARQSGARVVIRDGAVSKGDNVEERLATLRRLRDSGLITADDYEAKKAEILAGL